MRSFKLTSIAIAVCGLFVSPYVAAEQYDQLIGPNVSGKDEIIVGSPQTPPAQAVVLNSGTGIVDTNDGGSISIYAQTTGVWSVFFCSGFDRRF